MRNANTYAWPILRSATGEAGNIEPLIRSLERSREPGGGNELQALASELLIPGVLCSAAPKVVREILSLLESAEPATARRFLRIIVDLVETATVASQEFVARASVGAIEPYADYEALRADLLASAQEGEPRYRRDFLRAWRGQVGELHVLAGFLLSHCQATSAGLLDRYDLAIASTVEPQWQLMLFESARRVAAQSNQEAEYLSGHSNSTVPLSRVIASILLASSLDNTQLSKVVGELNELRIISLPSLLRTVPPDSRMRVYEAAFQCESTPPSMAMLYAFDILRTAFDESMRQYGESFIPDTWAPKYQRKFDFRSLPLPMVTYLNLIQRKAIRLLLANEFIWGKTTNLWRQFGLPETRDELRGLLERAEGAEVDR
jgi:hypothetical protein